MVAKLCDVSRADIHETYTANMVISSDRVSWLIDHFPKGGGST